MTDTERVTERLQPQKQIILFIDDDIEIREEVFKDSLSKIEDLDTLFIHPRDLAGLADGDLEQVSLVIADQFLNSYWGKVYTTEFLERLRAKKPNLCVIETSYCPGPLIFNNSIGVFDTSDLGYEISNNISAWPKTASFFIEKIKWEANYAFKEAQKVENTDENDDQFLETYNELIENFDRLTKDPNFRKLLDLVTATEDDFTLAFMTDNDIVRRKNFLHLSWQVIGHLIYNHDENYLAMPSQRLKDSVEMALNI